MRKFPVLVLVGCGVALLGGCAGKAPVISSGDLSLRETTDEGVLVGINLRADNRSDQAIPLRQVSYTLYLDGQPVFSGVRSAEAIVRRFGSQTIRLPAAFKAPGTLGAQTPFRIDGTLIYRSKGVFSDVLFDAEIVKPEISFTISGTADLSAPASIP